VPGGEVVPDDDVRAAERAREIARDERVRGRRGVAEVERLDDRRVRAGLGEQLELPWQRREERRGELGAEHADGVRLEGQDHRRGAAPVRELAGEREEPLVPEVHAVEVADRDGAAAQPASVAGLLERAVHVHRARS
jgi:hypothetical protein